MGERMREIGLLAGPCAFGVVTGLNGGGNLLASFTAGRVIVPRAAWSLLLLAFLGPLLVGTQVARTVGESVIDLPGQGEAGFVLIVVVSMLVVLASWRLRIPTSMTLALSGAMLGWVLAGSHDSAIRWKGTAKVLAGTPVSVLAGLGGAFLTYRLVRRPFASRPHARVLELARYQYLTSALQAVAYGSNDMEKTVGLVAVAEVLARGRGTPQFETWLPLVLAFCSFALGSLVGGWRVARRVESGVVRLRPMEAMSEQLSAGLAVAVLSLAGAPVSSTQTVGGALVGVGASVRVSGVRWGMVRGMLGSWLVTLPLALLGCLLLHLILRGAMGVR